MPLSSRLVALRDRAVRTLGERPVGVAVERLRAIIGPAQIPASEVDAQAAWTKLRDGETPTAIELAALEIVLRLLRPAPLSRAGALDALPTRPTDPLYSRELNERWAVFQRRALTWLPSIGMVTTNTGVHVGTGFIVRPGVLATNRHVLDDLSFGSGELGRGQARVSFQREHGSVGDAAQTLDVIGVVAIHTQHDIALLELERADRPPVPLALTAVQEGESVVVVGYPSRDPSRNPLFLDAVFGGKFGVKRASLGEVLGGTAEPQLFHDCSTASGNSGSPVFSLDSGNVVGIHRAGFFMYRNEALDQPTLTGFVT